jgi:Zn-dependent peptidase ImmA (M78 family)
LKSLTSQLATRGMQAALRVRQRLGADLHSPICVYDACDKLGVQVRFAEINSMEGMYYYGSRAKIFIGARRPLPRRNFTCGHELGHHVFGHGSTIDQLQETTSSPAWQPDEFLVNSFSAALLMPHVGLKRSFAVRSTTPDQATPQEVFAISCNFGVGYDTLVNHLAYGAQLIRPDRAKELSRSSPKEIRKRLLGRDTQEPLVVVDKYWSAPTVDLEVGTFLITPGQSVAEGSTLSHCASFATTELFQAVSPGLGRLVNKRTADSRFVRVSRYQFVGLSKFRHLEENSENEHQPIVDR